METNDGIDYTDPDDLARTLKRDEFLGGRGYCYKDGGGTRADLDYMLSIGTPVILLIAEDRWAHYITVYGFDRKTNTYLIANSEDYTADKLMNLWGFDDVSWEVDAAYALTNVNSNTLFSYSSDGCNQGWVYSFEHDVSINELHNWDEIYYSKFNQEYVLGKNENGAFLNFFAHLGSKIVNLAEWLQNPGTELKVIPIINISNGHQSIFLGNLHKNIISSQFPAAGIVPNNSVGQPIDIHVRVDKAFLDRFNELHAGFVFRNSVGDIETSDSGPFRNYIDQAASDADPFNYVFKVRRNYSDTYRTVEFQLHRAFRKSQTWNLRGCWSDVDNDKLCDEHDPDIDNDGIPNAKDNCPYVYNPGQEATISGGTGDACWNPPSIETFRDWVRDRAKDGMVLKAIEEITRISGTQPPSDPCGCQGLCFSCPAQFKPVEGLLRESASRYTTNGIEFPAFAESLTAFLTGFSYKLANVEVKSSFLRIDGEKPKITMQLDTRNGGELVIRLPRVLIDNKSFFLRRDLPVTTRIDGVTLDGHEERNLKWRLITVRVPPGSRVLELSENRIGF
jgi:hypothetical protein